MRLLTQALTSIGSQRRFLFILSAAMLCIVLAGEGATRWIYRQAAEQAAAQAAVRVGLRADAAGYIMEATMQGMRALFDLAEDRARLMAAGDATYTAIEGRLAKLAERRSFGVFQVAAIDPDGVNRWSSIGGHVHVDLSDRAHFRVHFGDDSGLYVSEPIVGRVSGRETIQFSRRLNRRDGSFGGVTVLSVDPALLAQELTRLVGPSHGDVMLVRDRNSRPLARQRREAAIDPWARIGSALPGVWDNANLRAYSAADGQEFFLARRTLAGTPLAVVVFSPASEEMASLERLAFTLVLTRGGGLAALIGLGAWLISTRNRAATNLALVAATASAAEQARMLDNMDLSVCIMRVRDDEIPTVIFANRRYEAQRLARGAPRHVPTEAEPPFSRAERAAIVAALRKRGRITVERQYHAPNGNLRWVRLMFTTIGESNGELEFLSVAADIETEKAAAAAAISTSRLATLGELSAGLAHELSQPLSVISLSAEVSRMLLAQAGAELAAPALPSLAQVAERQGIIVNMVARAKTITDHLRSFSRQQGEELEPVPLAAVMRGAKLLVEGALHDHGVALAVEMPEDLPQVWGRQVLLEQVLTNLLINARDAMQEVPVGQRQVRVEAVAIGDRVRVNVLDHGPGIPEHVMGRLFEPFFTTKGAGQGTGLGLSICFGIMQSCGGTIAAANRPEGGAAFTLDFRPVTSPELAAAAAV